jgi:hypothetical protein
MACIRVQRDRVLKWPIRCQFYCVFVILGAFIFWFFCAHAREDQLLPATIVASTHTVFALILTFIFNGVKVYYNSDGIGRRFFWGYVQWIPWSEVREGRYHPYRQEFCIQGAGQRIWCSSDLIGWFHLHRYMSFRLRRERTLLWHAIKVHGQNFEYDADGETCDVGFYVHVWVHTVSRHVAVMRATASVISTLGPVRPTDQSTLETVLIVSALEGPYLPTVSRGIRQTSFALYSEVDE